MTILFLDVETSTYNKGHPFDPRNKLVSYSYAINDGGIEFKYFTDPDFIRTLVALFQNATLVVGFAIKFDLHWCVKSDVDYRLDTGIWDCQLAEFILSGQTLPYSSLNDALESYGLETKKDIVAELWEQGVQTEDIPVPILKEYNDWDIDRTRLLYKTQQQILSDKQKKLVLLEGEDLKTLQHAEFAGIKFDHKRAQELITEYRRKADDSTKFLASFLPALPDAFEFNWDSGDHLSAFLYGGTLTYDHADPEERIYKTGPNKGQTYIRNKWTEFKISFNKLFEPLEGTEVSKSKDKENVPKFYQTDEPTLLQLKAKTKVQQSILESIRARAKHTTIVKMAESIVNKSQELNWQDDMVHGQFNQNVVRTGRLSSSAPNLQNQPPEIDELFVTRYAN